MDHRAQKLCTICELLEYDDQADASYGPDKTFKSYHHASIWDLEVSSTKGCWFCKLLFAGFMKGRDSLPPYAGLQSQIVLRIILDRKFDKGIGHHLLSEWGLICASYGGGEEVVYVLRKGEWMLYSL
jgi:hypothetical protein